MMKITLIVLLGHTALLGTSAVNSCLDPADTDYRCIPGDGLMNLSYCEIADADAEGGDLALCLDAAGRESITELNLTFSEITTLPEGIFQNLTALEALTLFVNDLSTLPERSFEGLTALELLLLDDNELTTLPGGVFQGLTALKQLSLVRNSLSTLPEGIFQDLESLEWLYLGYTDLITLPEGIFQSLTSLKILNLTGNPLECLPTTTLPELDDDDLSDADRIIVDAYGIECGCSIPGVDDNVCGAQVCTAGPVGYTCATSSGQGSPSDAAAIIAGVLSAAAVVLVALAVCLTRRKIAKRNAIDTEEVPREGLPDTTEDPVHDNNINCLRQAFDRWLPHAWVTAKWLWGLVMALFFGAVVVGIVEEKDVLWKSCLAAAGLLLASAIVASVFAYRFGTHGPCSEQGQTGGQHETPVEVIAAFG